MRKSTARDTVRLSRTHRDVALADGPGKTLRATKWARYSCHAGSGLGIDTFCIFVALAFDMTTCITIHRRPSSVMQNHGNHVGTGGIRAPASALTGAGYDFLGQPFSLPSSAYNIIQQLSRTTRMSIQRYPFSDFVNVTPVKSRRSGSGRELQTFQSGRLWLPTGARGVFGGQV